MTIYILSRQVITNIAIAALFAIVFINQLQPAFAQVNPGGGQSQNTQDTSYENTQNEVIYTNTTNTNVTTNQNLPKRGDTGEVFKVTTYEPSLLYASSGKERITLKGFVTVSNTRKFSNVWFEWGETPTLSEKTSSQLINRSAVFQKRLTQLDSSKTYYYRAVGQNPEGVVYGEVVTVRPQRIVAAVTKTQTARIVNTKTVSTNTKTQTASTVTSKNANNVIASTATSSTVNNTNQTALTGVNNTGGLFPNTFLEWIVLAILVFITVGFILYLVDLFQEIKKKKDEEEKGRANNLFAQA